MNRILAIDGNNLAYRANFVNGDLTNGAIYGSFNIIKNLIHQFPSYAYFIFWDVGGETKRHIIAKKYIDKGLITSKYKDRDHSGMEDFFKQLKILREKVDLIGVNSVYKSSVEADDLIGTFANKFQNDYNILIISSDKDFYQLINDKINLYRPVTNELIDKQKFIDKYGIDPKLMLHVGALTGDDGDSIEGIDGIGEKTAISLMKKYGSLHKMLKSDEAKNDKSKKLKSIFSNIEKLKLAYFLKKINVNIDYDFQIEKYYGVKIQDLKDFFEEIGFNSFIKNFKLWEDLQ